jgi:hypothetical protein
MSPRNLSRPIALAFFLGFIALAFTIPAQTENTLFAPVHNQGMTKGYCASTLDQPVVYFSNTFDANTKARNKISTQPLNFAFKNYLIEEYDFKTNSNVPTQCSLFETLSQAEANKRELLSQAQQGRKQVVEVNWSPGPIAEVPQGDDSVAIGPNGPPPTHTFCAVGHESTMYFSAVFDTVGALPIPAWNDAFNEFLRKTYGIQPEVEPTCTIMNTVREAERNLNARVGGVRANNHKAVETGWRYNASLVVTKPAPKPKAKVDDDPEPTPRRPAAQTAPPSQSSKEFAMKEGPLVLDYCRKDPILSRVFDCYRVQRAVYNYRMQNGRTDSLASLFTQEKLNCAECIDNGAVMLWVRERTTAQKISQKVSNCIEQKFIVGFYDKPYISHMQEIYKASVAACNK